MRTGATKTWYWEVQMSQRHPCHADIGKDVMAGITHKEQVLEMGIDKYNEECRAIVMRYSKEWETTVWRMGRWIDFQNDYKTLNPSFMESVWWVFQQLFNKGLVYKGFKVSSRYLTLICQTS